MNTVFDAVKEGARRARLHVVDKILSYIDRIKCTNKSIVGDDLNSDPVTILYADRQNSKKAGSFREAP